MIKYNGEIIHSLPVGRFVINENWNNSMATYYPEIVVYRIENGEVVENRYSAGEGRDYGQVQARLDVKIDTEQADAFRARDGRSLR